MPIFLKKELGGKERNNTILLQLSKCKFLSICSLEQYFPSCASSHSRPRVHGPSGLRQGSRPLPWRRPEDHGFWGRELLA